MLGPMNYLNMSCTALHGVAAEGARHATKALAKWLGRNVQISTEGFQQVPLSDLSEMVGQQDEPIAAVQMSIAGDLSGHVLLCLPLKAAQYVVSTLLGTPQELDLYSDELARSCIQETGNLVGSAYIGSIATWLDLVAKPLAPQVAVDLPSALIEPLLVEQAMLSDLALLAKTDFRLEDVSVDWVFYMLPSPESMKLIEAKCNQ